MDFERAGADVIGQRKISAPLSGCDRAGESGEQWLRITVRNGQHGNFGDDGRIFHLQALGIFFRGYTRSKRVAGEDGIVGNAAALHALARAETAFRKSLPGRVAVDLGIGIDDAADGAVFGSHFGFDTAPGVAVTRDGDRSFHGDAEAFKALVIFGDTVVDINERGDDIAIFRKGIVGGQLLVFLAGARLAGDVGLLDLGGKVHGAVGAGPALAVEKLGLAF